MKKEQNNQNDTADRDSTATAGYVATEEEQGWLAIMRLNKLLDRDEINKRWKIFKWHITFSWRSRKNLWGRFGGGWNWKLGFQAGGSTIIISLLVFELSIKRAT